MTGRGRERGLQKLKWKRGLQDEKAIEVIGIIAKNNRKKRKKRKLRSHTRKTRRKEE